MTNKNETRTIAGIALLSLAGALATAALLSSCATLFGRPTELVLPNQETAMGIIWGAYGRKEPPPKIYWRTGDSLDCNEHRGFTALTFQGNKCVSGRTVSPISVEVAWVDGQKMSETALAHELWHAALAYQGVVDPLHVTEGWAGTANCGCERASAGIVQKANAELQKVGW